MTVTATDEFTDRTQGMREQIIEVERFVGLDVLGDDFSAGNPIRR